VSVKAIEEKWHDLALPKELFDELLRIGNLTGDIEWLKFFAIACSSLVEVCPSAFCLAVLCSVMIYTVEVVKQHGLLSPEFTYLLQAILVAVKCSTYVTVVDFL